MTPVGDHQQMAPTVVASSGALLATPVTHTFRVDGMQCGHCVSIITSAVRDLDGVQSTAVDRTEGTVTVQGINLDDQEIRESILKAGYTVRP